MFRKFVAVAGFAAAIAFSTGVARADTTATFNGSSCPQCAPATYMLTVSGSPGNYTVTLQIQFTGAVPSNANYISAVAFNLGAGSGLSAGDLNAFQINGSNQTVTPNWETFVGANANNGGCNMNGGAGWLCSGVSSAALTSAPVVNGNTLTWTWTGVNLGGSLDTNTADWSIQVKYNNSSGTLNGWLISEEPVSTPEPGTLALLAAGLIPLILVGRRLLA